MNGTFPKFNLAAAVATLVISAIWIFASRVPAGSTTQGAIPAPQAGFAAPDFTLETPDGEAITLSNLRGRPVLINLWASWCGPCRAEMPAIEAVYNTYKDEGFTVLAVNATNQDDRAAAVQFVEAHNLTFPILLDLSGEVSRQYALRALPSTFFVDQDGIIQEVVIGGPMAEALLLSRVQELIEGAE
jgi:peroxiredoxin